MQPSDQGSKLMISMLQFLFSFAAMAVGVVVFTFATFTTKGELQAKDKADDVAMSFVREDVKEIKRDVKDLLKHSKR